MIDAHSFNDDARGNRTTAERTSYRADYRGRALVGARGVSIAILAMVVAVVVASSAAAAADPGTHEVQITDGDGNVNASFQYDAGGMVSINYTDKQIYTNYFLENPNESATAIRLAIGHSTSSNHTIVVGPGTYRGNVTITQPNRTIRASEGPSRTSLEPYSSDEAGFNITAENTTIRNVRVAGYNDSADDAGIAVHSANALVTDNVIEYNGVGISDTGSNSRQSTYINNTVINNVASGFVIEANLTTLNGNTISKNSKDGIELRNSSQVTIHQNRLMNNTRDALRLFKVNSSYIASNYGSGNSDGIEAVRSVENSFVDNTFFQNNDAGIDGGWVSNNTFVANNVSQNSDGIILQYSANNTFSGTIVTDNANYGIGLSVSSNNEFNQPFISRNGDEAYLAVYVIGGSNEVYDLDLGDPISDVTYDVESTNISIMPVPNSAQPPHSELNAIGAPIYVTNTTSPASTEFTAHYTDDDVANLAESTIELWNYSATTANWTQAAEVDLDTGGNTISTKISNTAVLGLYARSASSSGASGSGSGGGGYYLPPSSDSGPEFAITAIGLSNDAVAVGETVTVTVDVDNDGDEHGDYTGTLTADGQTVDSGTVTVNSNWHSTLRLSTTFDRPGTYQLAVDGESAGTVEVTGASAFSVSDVSLSPTSVESGGTVTITATVTNDGSAEGTVDVPLVVDGEEVDSRSVTLGAGESKTVSFERTFDEPGSVSIGGVTAGSVEMQTESGDGADSGGSDGGVGLVVFLLGGFGLVAVGLAGAYFLYPKEVLEAWQQVQSKVEDLTGGSR